MSRDLGRDVPALETLYARKLWADFSFPEIGGVFQYKLEEYCGVSLSSELRSQESGRLRARLEEQLGKPACLSSKPFLKPIGRSNSTRGQPYLGVRKAQRYKWGAYCWTNWRWTAVHAL